MSELNRFDLEEAQKQFNRLLKTPEGKAVIAASFGVERLVTPDEAAREEASKPKVAVLVPTHKKPENETSQAYSYLHAFSRDKVRFVPSPAIGSSVVHWARNQLLAKLYQSKREFDYVLFMDDDMEPPADALIRLLDRKVDIVGAVCTVRTDPALPNVRHWDAEKKQYMTADIPQPGFYALKDGAVGTGLILISKKALDAVGEYYLSCGYETKYMGMSKKVAERVSAGRRKAFERTSDAWWFRFFPHMEGDGEFGEDLSFCFAARECGFEIFADATFKTGHVGSYSYSLEDYWAYRPEAIKDGKVVNIVPEQREQESQIVVVE